MYHVGLANPEDPDAIFENGGFCGLMGKEKLDRASFLDADAPECGIEGKPCAVFCWTDGCKMAGLSYRCKFPKSQVK